MRPDPRLSRVGEVLILSLPLDPDLARLFPARLKRLRRVLLSPARAGMAAALAEGDRKVTLALPDTPTGHAMAGHLLGRIDAIMAETYAEAAVARRLDLPVAELRDRARAASVTARICHADRQGRRYGYAAYPVADILRLAKGRP